MLDKALALRANGEGNWLAFADPQYEALNGMFGGWTAAIILRSVMLQADAGSGPSALTLNYIKRVEPGSDVIIQIRRVGGGRSIQHWQAEMLDSREGHVLAYAMLVFSVRRETDGRTEPAMPAVPAPDGLEEFHPPGRLGQQFLVRPVQGYPPFARDSTASIGWVRTAPGRRVDHLQLALLSDLYPPRPFFWSDGPRPYATMTLSMYFHATQGEIEALGEDYLLNEAIGTRGECSTSGQQARFWSRSGKLLLTSEQLGWFR